MAVIGGEVPEGGNMASYTSCRQYCPPQGRLAVTGKVRAEVDRIRVSIEDTMNTIKNRDSITLSTIDRTNREMSALYDKTRSEVQLLNQKAVTELAQTCDTIPYNMGRNNLQIVNGIIEKQKNLFQKQTDGFDRDAEQKLSKIMVDTWSVRQTTDGADANATNGLQDAEIGSVLSRAKAGINV